jgi:hypothetical protein
MLGIRLLLVGGGTLPGTQAASRLRPYWSVCVMPSRRVRQENTPRLRLTVIGAGKRSFRFLIRRGDGPVLGSIRYFLRVRVGRPSGGAAGAATLQ